MLFQTRPARAYHTLGRVDSAPVPLTGTSGAGTLGCADLALRSDWGAAPVERFVVRVLRVGLIGAVAGLATVTVASASPLLTYSRDIGVFRTAEVSPVDIVRGPSGDWFVMDEGLACIKEYSPANLSAPVRTFFTCGVLGDDATHISRARGIGIDHATGDIWIADTNNNRVVKFDPSTGTVLVSTRVAAAAGGALDQPGDVAVDTNGNAYVIDLRNRVVKVDHNGTYRRQFGSTGTHAGHMRAPLSIAFSAVGADAVYVSDTGNHRVDKWSLTGSWIRAFGKQGTGRGALSKQARGVALDGKGRIYVADTGGNRIIRFAADGTALASLGDGLPYYHHGPLQLFYGARGLYVSGRTLAVTDMWGYRVLFWTLGGASTSQRIGGGAVPCSTNLTSPGDAPPCNGHLEPHGLAIDSAGHIYVSDYWHNWIEKFSANGTFLARWGIGRGSGPGTLNLPGGLAVDNARGYLYIANRENRDVDRWNLSNGTFNHRFPMPAGASFAKGWPRAVAVNEITGRFYAADEKDNQFVIFSSTSNTPLAIVKRYGTGTGHRLGSLHSLAWDPSTHSLYVADFTNRMIHVYDGRGNWIRSFSVANTPNGVAVADGIVYVMSFRLLEYTTTGTLIGAFGSTGSGDSQFFHPYGGIALDASGRVLIADSGNHRVKVFTP
jgi:tripartite motif-containing protein 71